MSLWLLCFPCFLSGGVSWLLVKLSPPILLDYPNHRSLHARPTPRGGGIGIVFGVLVGMMLMVAQHIRLEEGVISLGIAAVLLAAVSFVDDLRSLPPLLRLIIQAALSGIWLAFGFWLRSFTLPGWTWHWPVVIGVTFSWLWLMWATNLYNFMDGMDGFAGGMAIFGFGTLSWFGFQGKEISFVLLSATVAVAALGFLVFNFPPARVFLGDVGSTFLGFSAGGLILWGDRQHLFPFWLGALPFAPFIVDATITLLKRILKREKVWKAHKSHYYQRFVQMGWGHQKVLIGEYILMALSALAAVWIFLEPKFQRIGFWGVVVGYSILLFWAEQYLKKHAT